MMNESGKITDIHKIYYVRGYKTLTPRAKSVYRDACQEVMDGPGLYNNQRELLVIYANTYDTYLTCIEIVQKEGVLLTYTDKLGQLRYYTHPAHNVAVLEAKILMSYAKDFYMNLPQTVKAYAKKEVLPRDDQDEYNL